MAYEGRIVLTSCRRHVFEGISNSRQCLRDMSGRSEYMVNEPCSCGIGEKYKKCHGALEYPYLPMRVERSYLRPPLSRQRAVNRRRESRCYRVIVACNRRVYNAESSES